MLNTTEIRAGIERYERVQQEETTRKDHRALWFSICALLGSIALFALELAHQFVDQFVDLPKISRASSAVLAITMLLLIGFLKRTLDKMKP